MQLIRALASYPALPLKPLAIRQATFSLPFGHHEDTVTLTPAPIKLAQKIEIHPAVSPRWTGKDKTVFLKRLQALLQKLDLFAADLPQIILQQDFPDQDARNRYFLEQAKILLDSKDCQVFSPETEKMLVRLLAQVKVNQLIYDPHHRLSSEVHRALNAFLPNFSEWLKLPLALFPEIYVNETPKEQQQRAAYYDGSRHVIGVDQFEQKTELLSTMIHELRHAKDMVLIATEPEAKRQERLRNRMATLIETGHEPRRLTYQIDVLESNEMVSKAFSKTLVTPVFPLEMRQQLATLVKNLLEKPSQHYRFCQWSLSGGKFSYAIRISRLVQDQLNRMVEDDPAFQEQYATVQESQNIVRRYVEAKLLQAAQLEEETKRCLKSRPILTTYAAYFPEPKERDRAMDDLLASGCFRPDPKDVTVTPLERVFLYFCAPREMMARIMQEIYEQRIYQKLLESVPREIQPLVQDDIHKLQAQINQSEERMKLEESLYELVKRINQKHAFPEDPEQGKIFQKLCEDFLNLPPVQKILKDPKVYEQYAGLPAGVMLRYLKEICHVNIQIPESKT